MSGGGMAADSNGFIYVLDANGTFDTTLDSNGFPSKSDYGNAMLKLSAANGKLVVADYFDMFNTVSESDADLDLGSGGPLLLPDQTDSNGIVHHLIVGAGKDRNIYLADRDNLGKFNPATIPRTATSINKSTGRWRASSIPLPPSSTASSTTLGMATPSRPFPDQRAHRHQSLERVANNLPASWPNTNHLG